MVRAQAQREKVQFLVDGEPCAAWHYPGTTGGCVVMASGFGVTKEVGADRFAARFHDAGFSVLTFDFRHLGESGGQPRQIVSLAEQVDDFRAAVACARRLPEVDAARVAIWGFSASGGHVFAVAARDRELAAAIAQAPLVDAFAIAPGALRSQRPLAGLRFVARALADGIGRRFGRQPLLVPLVGPPGTVTSLTTPDAQGLAEALDPDGEHPEWQQEISAWSAFRIGFHRPGRYAQFVQSPLLVVAFEGDGVVLAEPAAAAAATAPHGELLLLPGGHYAAFEAWHGETAEREVAFLRRHLLGILEPDG